MFTSTRFGILLTAALVAMIASLPASAAPLLNGVAIHTELGKEQFLAGLYTDTLTADANQLFSADENKRLQVRVLADTLPSRRFKRMWIEGMAINSNQQALQEHAQNMADFSNMLRIKLIAGDILTIDRSRDEGVSVILNGTTLGQIDDERFFDLLMLTWIGPVPLSSTFRENLLKQGDVDSALLTRFESTRPTDARIATIENAVAEDNRERVAQQADRRAQAGDGAGAALAAASALDKPKLALAPPSLAMDAPPAPRAQPQPEPQPEPAKAQPSPQPKPAPQAKPEPSQPAQVAKATPAKAAPANDVFEDEAEDSFTAESLLSQQLYIGQLKRLAQQKLEYPRAALRRGWEGSVRLDVTLNRTGRVVGIEVSESAEHDVLTKEALRAVNAASFPSMPDDVRGETFLFTLPVAFKLQ